MCYLCVPKVVTGILKEKPVPFETGRNNNESKKTGKGKETNFSLASLERSISGFTLHCQFAEVCDDLMQ